MTPLLVIRHGPTEWNAQFRIQGRADQPLSPAGVAIVQGWRVPLGWGDAQCFSSPLQRAMGTARLLGLEPKPDAALIEMDWGEWEGRSLLDLRAEFGAAMAANEARGLDFRPSGGESPREVQERLLPFLASQTSPAVAITHKGVLRALYALASGWTMQDKPPRKLIDGCAHSFSIGPGGSPTVAQLNIPLARPA